MGVRAAGWAPSPGPLEMRRIARGWEGRLWLCLSNRNSDSTDREIPVSPPTGTHKLDADFSLGLCAPGRVAFPGHGHIQPFSNKQRDTPPPRCLGCSDSTLSPDLAPAACRMQPALLLTHLHVFLLHGLIVG